MFSVTIPLLLIVIAAGLPSLTLCLLIFQLIRLRRKKREQNLVQARSAMAVQPQSCFEGFGGHIHQELMEQQIDAVFNALVTVLETERLKLKALMGHPLPTLATPFQHAFQHPEEKNADRNIPSESEEQPAAEPTLGQQVAAMSQEGMTAAEIARQLGLSQAEITLAMKMSAGGKGRVGRKLQALA